MPRLPSAMPRRRRALRAAAGGLLAACACARELPLLRGAGGPPGAESSWGPSFVGQPTRRCAVLRGASVPRGAISEGGEALAGARGAASAGTEEGSIWSGLRSAAAGAAVFAVLLGVPGLPSDGPGGVAPFNVQPASAISRSLYASGSRVNKDPVSLLQLSLPLEEAQGEKAAEAVRAYQGLQESLPKQVRGRQFAAANGIIDDCINKLKSTRPKMLEPVVAARKPEAEKLLAEMDKDLQDMKALIGQGQAASNGSPQQEQAAVDLEAAYPKVQAKLGAFEELCLPEGYYTPVPATYSGLPQLRGRATVEITLKRPPNSKEKKYAYEDERYSEAKLKVRLDGYSAPVSAGNFMDLVDKGFYDGMAIQRADGLIIQTGDPGKKFKNGYQPTPGGKVRKIPLETGIKGVKDPVYGETLDEAGKVGVQVKLPFQVDGTISMAREEFDDDSASSQVFLFQFDSDMTPAGKNFFDGRYGAFGYTVDGAQWLRQIKPEDIIVSMKITDGLDKLVRPS